MPETVTLTSAAIAEAGIDTWTIKPVSLEHLLVLNGNVAANENRLMAVAAQVRGRVVEMPRDLGARVQKGSPLVVLESVELGEAQEEFIKALSDLRLADRTYERAKVLVGSKAISQGEFQAREGDYLGKRASAEASERGLRLLGESEAEIARIRAAIESGAALTFPGGIRLSVRAPFDGRVTERKVAPGALVEALQPLVTIVDISSVWVFMQAYEKDLSMLREGVGVTIRAEAYPERAFKGRIDFLGSMVDPATRTIQLRATVSNPDEQLRPGMFVKAQVNVPQSYEGKTVVAVPQSAFQTLEGRAVLFVRTSAGAFERRLVEIGHTFEGFTEVYSGVKAGDVVVTEGSFILKSEFAKASLADEH
ncbi:MAG: efflux RND transporter periplasmic adaptor subunit [Vicinamibacteria bacterium]|nr:efflux RND transporter periplasmic adaptor subunit [Vicinamibacteria bacterium]MBP9944873.1 efflux RND transporter periplasmic adaptor subunit [Vicinamibacteria bacterium]